jgi:hypothetical protein
LLSVGVNNGQERELKFTPARSSPPAEQERIEYLEKKIQTKDEVLAELMAEHVARKKVFGNSDQGLDAAWAFFVQVRA